MLSSRQGGQITLGRMAPLNGVAVAANEQNIYAVLQRWPEETVTALLPRLEQALGVAQAEEPDQRTRRKPVRERLARFKLEVHPDRT